MSLKDWRKRLKVLYKRYDELRSNERSSSREIYLAVMAFEHTFKAYLMFLQLEEMRNE